MSNQIQKTGNPSADSIISLLQSDKTKAELAKVLPRHLTIERLSKVILYQIRKVPKLQLCTLESLIACVRQLAELGLEPGGVKGHAYLIPFENKKLNKLECTLILGYRGMIELAIRSGKVASVEAHIVFEKDEFEIEYGTTPRLRHVPTITGNPGQPIAAYMIARLINSPIPQVEMMTRDAIMLIKARSRSKDNGPWVTDELEMWRKTVTRRGLKYVPMSEEMADALNADDGDYVDGEVLAERMTAPEESATSRAKASVKKAAKELEGPSMDVIETPMEQATVEAKS